jgi:stage II sporulation protein M
MKKQKKVNYFKFNIGTLILLIGIISYILEILYSLYSYLDLIGFLLIWLGLCIHLILVGDKPFFKSKEFIKESKNFIYFGIITFFLFFVVGFLYPNFLKQEIITFLQELVKKTENLNQIELIKFIFLNNVQSSFMGLIFGIFFGIFPFFLLISNGYVLGFVSSLSVNVGGFGVLLKLLPHGIFELPAIFISLGLGMKFGGFIFQKDKLKEFRRYFLNSLRVFIFVVVQLLIIAAIIEGSLIFIFG